MSWLKLTSQVKSKKHKEIEDENTQRENLAKQEKQELLDKTKWLSSQIFPLLELWKQLDCDRIVKDIQGNVFSGGLGQLEIRFGYSVKGIVATESPEGWVFGKSQSRQLADVLLQEGFSQDKPESFKITREINRVNVSSHINSDGDEVFDERIITVFSLTIDSKNIYCDGKILGTLNDIKNIQILENRIDEILARRLVS